MVRYRDTSQFDVGYRPVFDGRSILLKCCQAFIRCRKTRVRRQWSRYRFQQARLGGGSPRSRQQAK